MQILIIENKSFVSLLDSSFIQIKSDSTILDGCYKYEWYMYKHIYTCVFILHALSNKAISGSYE